MTGLPTEATAYLVFICVLSISADAGAEPSPEHTPLPAQPELTPTLDELFERGVEHQRSLRWGEALSAFRRAREGATGKNAIAIDFNIGVCERALGHYVAAHRAFVALREQDTLDANRRAEVATYVDEMKRLIARARVTLVPESAGLSVDGRSLFDDPELDGEYSLGPATSTKNIESVQRRSFVVVLDPGVHIFRATRPGHAEGIVRRSFRPGESVDLPLNLDILPATIVVASEPRGAIVRVNDREVGVTPLQLERLAGTYQLEIEQSDYNTHHQPLSLRPGQHREISVPLTRYDPPVTERWWFWTSIIGGPLAIGLVTYLATRPKPERPPYEGGSAGWVARVQ